MGAPYLRLEGSLEVALPAEEAFPLFSPEGERRWVPGWDPVVLHPPDGAWGEGMVFVTQEAGQPAFWVVARHDAARRAVTYYRVEPGRVVARVEVRCEPAGPGRAKVWVAYSFVALGEAGAAQVAALDAAGYERKLRGWQEWIAHAIGGHGGAC